jgi:hypothetical protein
MGTDSSVETWLRFRDTTVQKSEEKLNMKINIAVKKEEIFIVKIFKYEKYKVTSEW